ncbi:AP endonuclease [Clostridia bacterium]|nr:AP endonuclease [Clostridia bacterium]
MLAGISTACFYPTHTETALRDLCALDIGATEIFINAASELTPDFIRELKKAADGGGVDILSLHPYTSGFESLYFFSDYERRFRDGMELYKSYYEAANLLGAEIVVFHGAADHYSGGMERYCERFGLLAEDARRYGVDLCHENVSRCVGKAPGFFAAMARLLPGAEFVLDIKQAKRAGEDPMEFVDAMGAALRHVHFSDHDDSNFCLVPGKGTFNTAKFLSAIRKNGFDGGVIVELYRENFEDIVEIMAGYQQLSDLISTVK